MPVPWFIGSNGAVHPPEVLRALSFFALNGGEGVGGAGHLKVSALAVPSGQVQVAPGVVGIRNRYPNATFQTYLDRYPNTTTVTINPTDSTGSRSDLLVARVSDPDFAGPVPADPVNGPYGYIEVIPGVPSSTTRALDLNLNYPAVEIARIDLPSNTGTVTNAHITNLRKLANPRRERQIYNVEITPGQELTSSTLVDWPSQYPTVTVPEWANKAIVRFDTLVGHQSPNVNGVFQVVLGASMAASQSFNFDLESGSQRVPITVIADFPISVSAGQQRTLRLQGRRSAGTGFLRTIASSYAQWDVEFQETAI